MQGHDEIVWAVEIHNQQLFSASADKTIRVWDIASKRCERVRPLRTSVGNASGHPPLRRLISNSITLLLRLADSVPVKVGTAPMPSPRPASTDPWAGGAAM